MGANGTPPSARRMWHDPAAHACDFAQRYAEPLDYAVSQRMIELSIDPNRTGMPDIDAGIRHAAFHPHGKVGGNSREPLGWRLESPGQSGGTDRRGRDAS
jgi:hypothetical protein